MQKLNLHLQLLPDVMKSVSLDGIPIEHITRVQTICELLTPAAKLIIFCHSDHKLLKLYLTIPVTTASAERNFSALKCILSSEIHWLNNA